MEFTEDQSKRLMELLRGISEVSDEDNDALVSRHSYNGQEFVITTPECLHPFIKKAEQEGSEDQ